MGDVPGGPRAREPIDAAVPLLKVDRATRDVPVDQVVTPRVEVDALLPNTRRDEYEGRKRGAERFSHFWRSGSTVLCLHVAVAQSEPTRKGQVTAFAQWITSLVDGLPEFHRPRRVVGEADQ